MMSFKSAKNKYRLRIVNNVLIIAGGALAAWSMAIPDTWVAADIKNFVGETFTMISSISKGIELTYFKNED